MNEVQSRLINLEQIVKELNVLYRYGYSESELISLNKPYSIEEIDETKEKIEISLFNMIIDVVIEGGKPQDKGIYNIIDNFSYVLGLRERKDFERFLNIVKSEFNNK